jgi:ABC-2 type transport system ATP-binding protein
MSSYNVPAVEATALEKSYGANRVLAGVDLRVERGTLFALLGPNGAGKTTMVRILATVAGFDVVRDRHRVRRAISLTGQYAAVDELQTGAENLRMTARLAGLGRSDARKRATELLERFDLVDAGNRRVGAYSGGMRRRLDLAASLVGEPSVIFLDEPTTGLDVRSRQAMWDVVSELVRGGVTVFLTTQYLEEADQLADRIAVLDGGSVVATGTAAQLKSRIGGDTVELHDAHGDLVREVATDGSVTGLRRALDVLDESGAEGVVTLRRPSLDDVFLALTTPDGRGERADVRRADTLKEIA